jgi:hypothetical protein
MSREPSLIECLTVVVSAPLGLACLVGGIAGGGFLIGAGGAVLLVWSLYMWHKAIAGYYSP